ncbi:hypothetical protein H112_07582 [Trichophyton rubrum D6]|uniref:Uncharacterized protein n=1 Tax=Trichophyton rubrum CBS 288.86 TaxID=1215330 RepID=A0A022VSR4_TRIRU|nr:hypothetical protein H100_07609 [Trichophyton rubrum MR850]EZF38221.1 hypothetical protein H102_07573 [Trichophyton rubrum CBS 100081]EZF48773.1 hypothetical protein H103_07595 [Trichophyton rubrum CBS 288.86]EZF59468.1 hypothetical protein H104_07544 [Trichophyton rubrum CBS 289.86]EZF80695.1 hypothetical protein H110_07592 [Trichophyton rubrum MR1448]EZF91374.1 hypothetical protein H113_07650 [Trichophyton rubrum MR1459]EZG02587.1 hypothetical protein H106_07426 [Trichophyton rubrum CBS 
MKIPFSFSQIPSMRTPKKRKKKVKTSKLEDPEKKPIKERRGVLAILLLQASEPDISMYWAC